MHAARAAYPAPPPRSAPCAASPRCPGRCSPGRRAPWRRAALPAPRGTSRPAPHAAQRAGRPRCGRGGGRAQAACADGRGGQQRKRGRRGTGSRPTPDMAAGPYRGAGLGGEASSLDRRPCLWLAMPADPQHLPSSTLAAGPRRGYPPTPAYPTPTNTPPPPHTTPEHEQQFGQLLIGQPPQRPAAALSQRLERLHRGLQGEACQEAGGARRRGVGTVSQRGFAAASLPAWRRAHWQAGPRGPHQAGGKFARPCRSTCPGRHAAAGTPNGRHAAAGTPTGRSSSRSAVCSCALKKDGPGCRPCRIIRVCGTRHGRAGGWG